MLEPRENGECVLHLSKEPGVDEYSLRECLQPAFTQTLRFLDATTLVCPMASYNTHRNLLHVQVCVF